MWYFKEENENGDVRDKDGKIYQLTECYRVIAPDGRKNAELGYTEFDSMQQCLEAWGLTLINKNER